MIVKISVEENGTEHRAMCDTESREAGYISAMEDVYLLCKEGVHEILSVALEGSPDAGSENAQISMPVPMMQECIDDLKNLIDAFEGEFPWQAPGSLKDLVKAMEHAIRAEQRRAELLKETMVEE